MFTGTESQTLRKEAYSVKLVVKFGRLLTPRVEGIHIREISSVEECGVVLAKEVAVILKHSQYCQFSHDAFLTVNHFCALAPTRALFLISVPESREVAAFLERQTGIRHESPQILAMRRGVVFAHASHDRINTAFLKTLYPE